MGSRCGAAAAGERCPSARHAWLGMESGVSWGGGSPGQPRRFVHGGAAAPHRCLPHSLPAARPRRPQHLPQLVRGAGPWCCGWEQQLRRWRGWNRAASLGTHRPVPEGPSVPERASPGSAPLWAGDAVTEVSWRQGPSWR